MKVHFAGNRERCGANLYRAGVRYRLESYYDHAVRNKVDPPEVWARFNHVIVDSGLFTLMFGSGSGQAFTMDDALAWQREYVRYIKSLGSVVPVDRSAFVELDVQKKLGVEAAWELRAKLREALPEHRIINVYHLEDGHPGRLLDWTGYVAISQPELRLNVGAEERKRITRVIAAEAHRRGIKVHLLGLTEKQYLRAFRFCDTCDSTSWQSSFRYGSNAHSVGRVTIAQIRGMAGGEIDSDNEQYWSARFALTDYTRYAGPQD